MLEIEETAAGSVAGRCFIKQDHQRADPGFAHEGVLVAVLSEAMALACGAHARAVDLRAALAHRVPVGSFVPIEARAEHQAGSGCRGRAGRHGPRALRAPLERASPRVAL
jgi:acyl-coenzyme A thioesterase PaaI-like protein